MQKRYCTRRTNLADEADVLTATVHQLRSQDEMERALETARSGVKDHPDNAGLRVAYGRVLLANGHFEEARAEFSGRQCRRLQMCGRSRGGLPRIPWSVVSRTP
jgi:hypothetical protein